MPIPQIEFCGRNISRLIIGGNPFSGNSHVSPALDGEMEDYYTTQHVKDALFRCMECGVNAMQLRGDKHIARILREFRLEGGSMHWIGQTAPELYPYENTVQLMKRYGAWAAYHHGTVTDTLFKAGEYAEIRRRLAVLREAGLAVGLGSHMPEVFEMAEREGWDADFYMCCVYNISKIDRVSSAVTGVINNGEPFDDEDRAVMYRFIRSTEKPCLAFKILGATRRCAMPADVRNAFEEAFANIKKTDAVVVGMFQRDRDQVAENTAIVTDILMNP